MNREPNNKNQLNGRTADHAVSGTTREKGRRKSYQKYFAALDLGTNNCRLMIAGVNDGACQVVDNFNRSIRLGEGLQASGMLTDAAMNRAIGALHACAGRMRHWPLQAVRGVATEACRQAGNAKAFLRRVREETGIQLDIITPREEAELALESCTSLLYANNHRRTRAILFDIGGGSTEIGWLRLDPVTRTQTLSGTVSIPFGVVSMAERFLPPGPGASLDAQAAYYREMVAFVRDRLHDFDEVHRIGAEVGRRNVTMLGTSGTITTLAGIALDLPRYSRSAVDGLTLTDEAALGAIDTLLELRLAGMAQHPCVGHDRSAFVLPGCAIFEAIHQLWPVDSITVADRGLRDGMVARMARNNTRCVEKWAPACQGESGVSRPSGSFRDGAIRPTSVISGL